MKVLTPIKAIRAYCIQCSGGMTKEVKLCNVEKCPLYPCKLVLSMIIDVLDKRC